MAVGLRPTPVLDEIRALAKELGVRVREVSVEELRDMALTDAPQGVVARAARRAFVEEDALFAPPGGAPFIVALDGVSDPHNLGAVMRTAESAGATGLMIPARRAASITPAATKAAAGAVERLDVAQVSGLPAALARAKRANLWVVGLDERAETSVFDLDAGLAEAGIVLVLGSEGGGLSRLARERCDLLLSIPMHGVIESLNVSAAAAVACFQIARARASMHPEGHR